MNRFSRHDRELLVFAICCTFVVWIYLLIHAVRIEERKVYMLDNTGTPVAVYYQEGKR